MAKSIVDFIEELDRNAELKEEYMKDPTGTAERYGLSEEDVKTIKNKDWDKVKKAFDDLSKSSRVVGHDR